MKERDEVTTHEIFQIIPRGKLSLLAAMLHLTPDAVRRWCREPLSDENPTGTGSLNPLDRLRIIISFAHAECPAMAVAIEEWISALNREHYERMKGAAFTAAQRVAQVRRTIREIADVMEAIATGDDLEREIAEMIAEVRRLEAMSIREPILREAR
ncbi:MAG: hypothetical protein AB1631_29595 [Acidobacteriota bacterium]